MSYKESLKEKTEQLKTSRLGKTGAIILVAGAFAISGCSSKDSVTTETHLNDSPDPALGSGGHDAVELEARDNLKIKDRKSAPADVVENADKVLEECLDFDHVNSSQEEARAFIEKIGEEAFVACLDEVHNSLPEDYR